MESRRSPVVFWCAIVLFNLAVAVIFAIAAEIYLARQAWNREFAATEMFRPDIDVSAYKFPVLHYPNPSYIKDQFAREGIDAMERFSPASLAEQDGILIRGERLFPLTAGVSRKKTIFCGEGGYWIVYDSDEHGFRNPVGSWSADPIDAAFIGDSFTHGACVDNDFGTQARAAGLSVLNLGTGGTGPLVQYAQYREFLAPKRPKVLVWVFYAEDLRDLVAELKSPILRRYLSHQEFSQHLAERQAEVDAALLDYYRVEYPKLLQANVDARATRKDIIFGRLVWKAAYLGHLRELPARLFAAPPAEPEEGLKVARFAELAGKMASDVRADGGRILFVYLPTWISYGARFDGYGIATKGDYLQHDEVVRIAREIGAEVLDVKADIFDKAADPVDLFTARRYRHFTPKGYDIVGAAIISRLHAMLRDQNAAER